MQWMRVNHAQLLGFIRLYTSKTRAGEILAITPVERCFAGSTRPHLLRSHRLRIARGEELGQATWPSRGSRR